MPKDHLVWIFGGVIDMYVADFANPGLDDVPLMVD
jgi:hypothetical protein